MSFENDTITARATAPGKSGVGIVRISGPRALSIVEEITGKSPKPRYCEYHSFLDENANIIDMGLVVYFKAPHSFTGEEVVELHCHGSMLVIDLLLKRIVELGARLAKPGEFSQRAFLNNKMDLTQAEAIADLIESTSVQAARCAIRSLQGEFSQHIHNVVNKLIDLRMYVEAAIDFPEEEIDFLADERINNDLQFLIQKLENIQSQAKQGALLREGMTVVIAGKPNAGKSSLLNCLSGKDIAIVTEIPGTTRDLLRENILIDGIPLHVIDTAGLRDTTDKVEQEGVRRALNEIENADRVLLVVDAVENKTLDFDAYLDGQKLSHKNITVIRNKIDKLNEQPTVEETKDFFVVSLSAKTGEGLGLLKEHLKKCIGVDDKIQEDTFMARRRHLDALAKALNLMKTGLSQFQSDKAGELLAEDLRQVQQVLGEITGEFTSDDLLGKIFSSFCIGK